MTHASDPTYLHRQYGDTDNLAARAHLHQRYSTHPQPWHEWVYDQFDLPPDARLLELGCGPGALWRENMARIPAGWQVLLTDRSPGMIAGAKKTLAAARKALDGEGKGPPAARHVSAQAQDAPRDMGDVLTAVMQAYTEAGSGLAGIRAAFAAARRARAAERNTRANARPEPVPAIRAAGPTFTFAVHDAQSLAYPDGAFDAVIANHMLYHVADIERVFAEIRRVLTPGGRLYAATNGARHMRELREVVRHALPEADRQIGSVAASFSLENGAAQLRPWFPQVTCLRHENGLRVPEVAPVLAYLASTQALSEEALDRCAVLLQRELDEKGVIEIAKDVGLFVAVRA